MKRLETTSLVSGRIFHESDLGERERLDSWQETKRIFEDGLFQQEGKAQACYLVKAVSFV